MKRIEMSVKEIERVEILSQLSARVLSQREAAERLNLSERQMRRLQRGYERGGAASLVSKRRGKASNRQIKIGERAEALHAIQTRYADFGPTLAAEYLSAEGIRFQKKRCGSG